MNNNNYPLHLQTSNLYTIYFKFIVKNNLLFFIMINTFIFCNLKYIIHFSLKYIIHHHIKTDT